MTLVIIILLFVVLVSTLALMKISANEEIEAQREMREYFEELINTATIDKEEWK